jgi:hypothetical protein
VGGLLTLVVRAALAAPELPTLLFMRALAVSDAYLHSDSFAHMLMAPRLSQVLVSSAVPRPVPHGWQARLDAGDHRGADLPWVQREMPSFHSPPAPVGPHSLSVALQQWKQRHTRSVLVS